MKFQGGVQIQKFDIRLLNASKLHFTSNMTGCEKNSAQYGAGVSEMLIYLFDNMYILP